MSQGVLDCITNEDVVVMTDRVKTTIGVRIFFATDEEHFIKDVLEIRLMFRLCFLRLSLH